MNEILEKSLRKAKRTVIAIIGLTVLLVGMIMIFLPGPAVLVIPVGLMILASEFVWARRLLRKLKAGLLSGESKGNKKKK